jgi:hypothetical protein
VDEAGMFASVTDPSATSTPEELRWRFATMPYDQHHTEPFAAYWYGYLSWYRGGTRAPDEMYHPLDRASREARAEGLSAGTGKLDTHLFAGSYYYSPTFWLDADRYRSGDRGVVTAGSVRRLTMGQVVRPAAKVLTWERSDFASMLRVAGQTSGRGAAATPAWNWAGSRPQVFLVDGSSDRASINDLIERATTTETDMLPDMLPTPTSIEPCDLCFSTTEENTERSRPTPNYAWFWATRDGVRGRDLAR